MRISFVIPALNEAQGIRRTIERIPVAELRRAGHEVEILVVDGDSQDGTAEAARKAGAKVLVETRRGYGRAYKTGFAAATGDIVVTGDADATYPFEDTVSFLRVLESEGYDFLTMNRFANLEPGSMSAKHRFGNWVLSTNARILFGVRLRDSQSGLWVLRRSALEALPIDSFSDGMAFSEELKVRAFQDPRLRAAEVAGRYKPRLGEAKLSSWRDGFRNLLHLWRMRFRPYPPRSATPR